MKYLPIVVALLIIVISNWCSYLIGSKDGYKIGCIHGAALYLANTKSQNNPAFGMQAYGDSYFWDSSVTRLDNVYIQCVSVPGTKDEFDCDTVK
jgi:hypothetical protein